jgi:hypothetical protein
MKYTTKAKIGIIIGIGLIVFVASLLGLPFREFDSKMQKISYENAKLEEAEEKMLDVIVQQKAEIESKIGGKINFP